MHGLTQVARSQKLAASRAHNQRDMLLYSKDLTAPQCTTSPWEPLALSPLLELPYIFIDHSMNRRHHSQVLCALRGRYRRDLSLHNKR